MRGAKLLADFARCFSDDFQIPANGVEQEGFCTAPSRRSSSHLIA
jgi:hypothetical protein